MSENVAFSCLGCGTPVASVFGKGADERRARKLCVSCWLTADEPTPGAAPPAQPTTCAGCWRRGEVGSLDRSRVLASSRHAADTGMVFCGDCLRRIGSWFLFGDGSESANHGRRMISAWENQEASRVRYEADRD